MADSRALFTPSFSRARNGLATKAVENVVDLLDYLERIMDARTIEELWDTHVSAMGSFGFDRLLYGYTRFRTPNSFGAHDDIVILTNHDPAYAKRFFDDGMYFHAPMVRWAAENTGACSWSWMQSNAHILSPSELKVVEMNRSFGVVSGFSVSFADTSTRIKGAIALTAPVDTPQSQVDALWAVEGRKIEAMNNMFHLRVNSLPYAATRKSLTKRQREALEWVGDGKTTADIAEIMGLTSATVEKHLRLAREALNAETTAQAVLKASFQNQIFVIEA
ncbi:Transcriptional activator protein LuxR [Aquimixticola soesokkakensis]|uniref:Transcriptional activator protein LuxR n=1 Tax=Aquimixticola soesokkakensis TaxID=1519096 RepID=A0A1Y5SH79_9RHOB|nr:LuxR family transcriptional regulator [Aquimixticola soesokkakensis]SLN40767.1 Transcriptional activator protein LuxR [Aquimixticola soesokkakensis]